MKKILLFLLLAAPAFGQVANPSIVLVASPPSGSCTSGLPDQQTIITGLLYSCQSGTWAQISGGGGGGGTVTSVAMTVPSWLTVGGSPITASGTLAVTATGSQTANEFLATPNGSTGPVGLRTIVAADVPTLNQSTTGNAATATALASTPTLCSTGNAPTGVLANGNATGCAAIGGGASYTNVVASSTSDTTVAAINAKCTGGQTYVASVPITFTAGGTINSGCTVSHWAGGVWLGSVSITFAGNVTQLGDPTLFFSGPTITFSSSNYGSPSVQAHAPVEWWGAKGDNSTADLTPIQACLTAAPVQCDLQTGNYRISGALSITTGNVGIHGQGIQFSKIQLTAATGNGITVAGGGTGSEIQGNTFDHFLIYRSVVPTSSTAAGLSISFCQLCNVSWVYSQDNAYDFYLTNFANSVMSDSWGGWTENYTSGLSNVYGIYVDGANAPQSSQFQRDVVDVTGAVGTTFHGFYLAGNNISDVLSDSFQASNTNYGIEVTSSSGGGFHESNIHFTNSILNGILTSCIKTSGLASSDKGTSVQFTGGNCNENASATGPSVDIESSQAVMVQALSIVPAATFATDLIYANSSSQLVLNGNVLTGSFAVGIQLNGTSATSVVGNSITSLDGSGLTAGIEATVSSTGNTIEGNNITDASGGVGIVFDGTSGHNTAKTDVFSGVGTTVTDSAGNNSWCDSTACHNLNTAATGITTNGTANQVWGMNSGGSAQGWQTISSGATVANLCSVVTLTNATCTSGQIVISSGTSSVTIASIPGTYLNLEMNWSGSLSSSGGGDVVYQFNSDTTSGHYSWSIVFGASTASACSGTTCGGTGSAANIHGCALGGTTALGSGGATAGPGGGKVFISGYTEAIGKTLVGTCGNYSSTSTFVDYYVGAWNGTGAITSMVLTPSTGTFGTTYLTLYGTN